MICISIDKQRCYVNLRLIYPPEGYRTGAIRYLEEEILKGVMDEIKTD